MSMVYENYSITKLLSNALNQCHFEADIKDICLTGENFSICRKMGPINKICGGKLQRKGTLIEVLVC